MNELISDIVCQVLVQKKSKALVYAVLNEFIPDYNPINLDYAGKPDDNTYRFESEDEMIECYISTPHVKQTFYWNKHVDNPDRVVVGVNITRDDQMVFSVTFHGAINLEAAYYLRLKKFLSSDIGVISYVNPADYDDGHDFEMRYGDEIYDCEK